MARVCIVKSRFHCRSGGAMWIVEIIGKGNKKMARGVNKVILVGNVGSDPEVKFAGNGNAICNLSLATSETWKDKQTGQPQEKTEWHRVVLFGKAAEIAGQYVRKGSQIYIEGKLQTRKWQDQSGQDRYSTEIVVDIGGSMQLLGGRSDGQPATQPHAPQPPRPVQHPSPSVINYDDDIQF